jgi:hypothetical protein
MFNALLACGATYKYLDKDTYTIFFMSLVLTVLIVISISVKNYSKVLLINRGSFNFRELRLSKKLGPYAEHFVSTFKMKYEEIK